MPPALPQECPLPIEGIDYFLGVFLLVGTLVSFLPQHVKLVMRTSHVGLSLYKGSVGTMTATCGLFYFSALQYYELFYCCPSPSVCFGHLMPFLQLAMILLCDVVILYLYVFYYDLHWFHDNGMDPHKAWAETRMAVLGTFLFQLVIMSAFTGLAVTSGFGSGPMDAFGTTLIVFSSLGQFIQWAPQIYKTYQLKKVGSLSLPMIFLQAGGAALTAYFFSLDGEGWYIWAPFVVSSVLLTILFVESYYYLRKEKVAAAAQAASSSAGLGVSGENDPLISSKVVN